MGRLLVAIAASILSASAGCGNVAEAQSGGARDTPPPAWSRCESDADCVVIPNGLCDYFAVHRAHADDARALASRVRARLVGHGRIRCEPTRPPATYCPEDVDRVSGFRRCRLRFEAEPSPRP